MGEVPMVASLARAIPSAMQMRPANIKVMRNARLAVGFEKKRCQEIANVLLLMFTCIVDESSRARYSSPISKNENSCSETLSHPPRPRLFIAVRGW